MKVTSNSSKTPVTTHIQETRLRFVMYFPYESWFHWTGFSDKSNTWEKLSIIDMEVERKHQNPTKFKTKELSDITNW